MIKIQITDSNVRAFRGFSEKNNKPYEFFKQKAYIFLSNSPYPEKVELPLESEKPYPLGDYDLLESSIYVDNNNRLQVKPVLALRPSVSNAGASPLSASK